MDEFYAIYHQDYLRKQYCDAVPEFVPPQEDVADIPLTAIVPPMPPEVLPMPTGNETAKRTTQTTPPSSVDVPEVSPITDSTTIVLQ